MRAVSRHSPVEGVHEGSAERIFGQVSVAVVVCQVESVLVSTTGGLAE